jgi:alkylation response protein AidB-like acyl-CoA dehydrogenase
MFIMMNAARLSVGLEGVAIGERAFQRALSWSRERMQGKPVGVQGAKTSPIIQHPDVKRMLLTMKSTTEAMRALAYWTSALLDRAHHHADESERKRCQSLVDLLIPVVKGWSTEMGIEVATLGVQVHGGMGFIEETGAAQHLRDARITTIYEGTTGIQANDLVGRKMGREGGRTALRCSWRSRSFPASSGAPTIRSSSRSPKRSRCRRTSFARPWSGCPRRMRPIPPRSPPRRCTC